MLPGPCASPPLQLILFNNLIPSVIILAGLILAKRKVIMCCPRISFLYVYCSQPNKCLASSIRLPGEKSRNGTSIAFLSWLYDIASVETTSDRYHHIECLFLWVGPSKDWKQQDLGVRPGAGLSEVSMGQSSVSL